MSIHNILLFTGILLSYLIVIYIVYVLAEKHTQKVKSIIKQRLNI